MTEKELKQEIIENFKKLIDAGDSTFPTGTLEEYYKMLNEEDDKEEFSGDANEFWLNVTLFLFKIQDKLEEKDYDLFCKLDFNSTSKLIDFLYTNKKQII